MSQRGASSGGRSTPSQTKQTPAALQVHHSQRSTASNTNSNSRSQGDSTLWAEERKSLAEYTFYREGTPPPPETAETETVKAEQPRRKFAGIWGAEQRVKRSNRASTICGLRRRTFWVVLAVAILLIVVAAGLGVGLSVGLNHKSKSKVDDSVSSPLASSTSASSLRPSSTGSASVATASNDPTSNAQAACPAANNTIYKVPHSDKSFLRICGIDYTGAKHAVDLGNVLTDNMQDCMINCAGYPGCTGCGWGLIPGDPGSGHRCWLKGDLEKSAQARSGWDFAILR